MRIFISYARVDMSARKQVCAILQDVHEYWYDMRLQAGQKWWDVILDNLNQSDGLLYLMSPESVASEYCRRECEIALEAGKVIIPALIQPNVEYPDWLEQIQYADISDDITSGESVRRLLGAITVAEQNHWKQQIAQRPLQTIPPEKKQRPEQNTDPAEIIAQAVAAMESENYDRAAFLLREAIENNYQTRFVNPAELLTEAEAILERQAYLREAEQEYRPLIDLVKSEKTRSIGCKGFADFQQHFPDYDPEDLAAICREAQTESPIIPPPFEWCDIPAGEVMLEAGGYVPEGGQTFEVERFWMAKYPITNAQYQAFVEDGYANPQWWDYSDAAKKWRSENPKPEDTAYPGDDLPRTNVNWYEAVAFCGWLSSQTGFEIALPSEQQWQRAAQGDDDRKYPWGNDFDKSRCNANESGIGRPTPVTQYPNGASPYGVQDMSGNVWEWCLTAYQRIVPGTDQENIDSAARRVLRGGSWFFSRRLARAAYRSSRLPDPRFNRYGFRVLRAPSP